MKRSFHHRIAIQRFLVEAEEVALDVIANGDALSTASRGAVSAQTGAEIRELVARVRAANVRPPREACTAFQLARESLTQAGRLLRMAMARAVLDRNDALRAALLALRRDHPPRARTVTMAACSLEAYAGVLRDHARELAGVIEPSAWIDLEARARAVRWTAATQRRSRARATDRAAERDRLLVAIEMRLRDVRTVCRLLHA